MVIEKQTGNQSENNNQPNIPTGPIVENKWYIRFAKFVRENPVLSLILIIPFLFNFIAKLLIERDIGRKVKEVRCATDEVHKLEKETEKMEKATEDDKNEKKLSQEKEEKLLSIRLINAEIREEIAEHSLCSFVRECGGISGGNGVLVDDLMHRSLVYKTSTLKRLYNKLEEEKKALKELTKEPANDRKTVDQPQISQLGQESPLRSQSTIPAA